MEWGLFLFAIGCFWLIASLEKKINFLMTQLYNIEEKLQELDNKFDDFDDNFQDFDDNFR